MLADPERQLLVAQLQHDRDRPPPPEARLAHVACGPLPGLRLLMAWRVAREATRERPTNARSVSQQSFPGSPSRPGPRPALPLPLHVRRRASGYGSLVVARAARRVPPAHAPSAVPGKRDA